jgi:phosphatidylglycerol:prolipoprotein diacylglycerol transferase
MLVHPQFDPVAIAIGPLAVHWYPDVCLRLCFILLGRWRIRRPQTAGVRRSSFCSGGCSALTSAGVSARSTNRSYYFSHPLEILAVWKGGMSSTAHWRAARLAWHARKTNRSFLEVGDFVGPLVPLGLMFGRIGNFINGELWGRAADPGLPWAMIFPQADAVPRHPSQLYQAGLEGLLLFLLLWTYSSRRHPVGAVSGAFLIGYGVFRSIGEFFRSPDAGIFGQSYTVSMGQWLSLPMILIGVWLIWRAYRTARTPML